MRRIATAFALWATLIVVAAIGARLILGHLTVGMVLIIACAAIVALPPDWDPAILIKRRREEARHRARLRATGPWPPAHFNCRCTVVPRNPSPDALPGETEADTIERLLREARDR